MPKRTKGPEALTQALICDLSLTVRFEPPSGNHYKRPTVRGRNIHWYLTDEAHAWNFAVATIAAGRRVGGKEHGVSYTVYQGSGHKGDVDNYAKTVLDGLVKAGVLKSDASVITMHANKQRDRDNPRTEIFVWRLK